MIRVSCRMGAAVLALLAGCSTHDVHTVPIDSLEGADFSFLKPGQTSREEAVRRLGDPTGKFQGGVILTYSMEPAPYHGLKPVRREPSLRNGPFLGWEEAVYSLVLVFDSESLLREFSLVKVR